tara:strand:+ start:34 stop:687 length:654 start_codon:yes stop_codon:yes gene_type:complete
MASMLYFKESAHADIPIFIEFVENPIAVNGKKDEKFDNISFPVRMINKGNEIRTPNNNGGEDYVIKTDAEFTWELSESLHEKVKDFSEKELCKITFITKTKNTRKFWKVEMITKDDLPKINESLPSVAEFKNQSIEAQSAMKNAIELIVHGKAELKQLPDLHEYIYKLLRVVQVKEEIEDAQIDENEEQAQEKEVEKELAIQEEKKEMAVEDEELPF